MLVIAIRRGQLAALVTAALGVLTLNFFFIVPRHRLAIAHSQDLVELIVLLIAAVVVGRLAAVARERAAEAESRAALAAAREREAKLVAEVASAILAGESIGAQLETIGNRVALATAAGRARVVLEPVPTAMPDEIAVPLHTRAGNAWLYLTNDVAWDQGAIERVAESLGRLDRRGRRTGADLRAGRRDRGLAPRGRRQDRDPPRDLPRSALAADRDHHRGLGARDRASPRPSGPS